MADDYQGMTEVNDVEHDDWREPPKWPKVVGIISIVYSCIMLLCNGGLAIMSLFQPQMMNMAEQQVFTDGVPPMLKQVPLVGVALLVFSFAMSVCLLIAGITTVGRHKKGRILHLIATGGILLSTLVSIPYQISMQSEIAEWVKANPDTVYAQQYSPAQSLIGLAIGLVFLLYPIFCIIWFGALKKRPEQDAPEVL